MVRIQISDEQNVDVKGINPAGDNVSKRKNHYI